MMSSHISTEGLLRYMERFHGYYIPKARGAVAAHVKSEKLIPKVCSGKASKK